MIYTRLPKLMMASSFHKGFTRAPAVICVMLYVLASITVTQETATAAANVSEPCYNYTVLDEPWRAINNTYASVRICDQSFTWSGWYRLFINNISAQIPDTCVVKYSCGTSLPLRIHGGHPTVQDGVVTRDVCAHWDNYCCYIGSYPIKVKACPGNYYVYELVSPTFCDYAYCADVSNINTSSTAVTPATTSTVYPSVDPCYNYTVLDEPWRANSSQSSSFLQE
ncbi:pancreatic secretory granule membrane major glycoprotein GP2-like [Labeo rohita]|uniref:pancreatic secretory granule membrane major glycoprotein GP2-like n=1 Tax=Labeo rohita TaxID=84645 RepID=UPI0021E2AA68|nr:pancreatic secretory granule membrane major glycoprotein GP2-like [Labeo rohita]